MSGHETKRLSRREVMRGSALAAGVATIAPIGATQAAGSMADRFVQSNQVGLEINGVEHQFELESRVTLLDKLDALISRDVLVIDDDPAARYLLQKCLASSRTRVIEAVDGTSGLQAARSTRPAMIFLDLQLPDASGEDILGALRRDSRLSSVPVAIMTSRMLSNEERDRLGERARVLRDPRVDEVVAAARAIGR